MRAPSGDRNTPAHRRRISFRFWSCRAAGTRRLNWGPCRHWSARAGIPCNNVMSSLVGGPDICAFGLTEVGPVAMDAYSETRDRVRRIRSLQLGYLILG